MMKLWFNDFMFITYCVTFLLAGAAGGITLYRRLVRRSASSLVNDILILCGGFTYWMSVVAYTRTRTLADDFTFVYEWWWPLRVIPVAIGLGLIAWHNFVRMLEDCRRIEDAKILAIKPVDDSKEPILIVENYTPIWGVYFRALDSKYDVHFAVDAEQALQRIAAVKYKVVVTDILLGKGQLTGFDVAKTIKKVLPMTYLIASTGHHDKFSVNDLRTHFDDVLYKAFSIEPLRRAVAKGMVQGRRWTELAFNFNKEKAS